MPSRAEVSTTSRTESMPARWPSTRGRWRCAAQRPLPPMMIAMCTGSCSKLTCRARASSDDPGAIQANSWSSDMMIPPRETVIVLEPISKMGAQHRGRRGARPARREEGEYRPYATDEQRSRAGCIAGRMPSPFLRWVLGRTTGAAASSRLRGERAEDGFQVRPDVVGDPPGPGRVGMDAIRLQHVRIQDDVLQQERDEHH